MPTLLLMRHGRTTANTAGLLAGRTPGVDLDTAGRAQVRTTAQRMANVRLAAVVSSPLRRCRATARAVLADRADGPTLEVEPQLTECDYGQWQGKKIADLIGDPMWKVVQQQPSAAVFPGGESLANVQARAVAAVRRHDATVAQRSGEKAVWVAVSHGDVIKAILADALGMHLDSFQRLDVLPSSVSIVRYGNERPQVLGVNTGAGDLGWVTGGTTTPTVGGGT